jgi:hypothetical protein
MTTAVLAWGSLIWCPGSLRIKSKWHTDGPEIPLEFARLSRDGRLTLVIHPSSPSGSSYWAYSQFDVLDEARRNLSQREGTSLENIHFATADRQTASSTAEPTQTIRSWLSRHADISSVIWTGLATNWQEKRGQAFSSEDAVKYLSELESQRDSNCFAYERAREYVVNAPALIQTEVRRRMQRKGWNDAILSKSLFE